MKGFEIFLNGEKISMAVCRGVACIFVEKTYIAMTGIDHCTYDYIRWGKIKLDVGDKIKIIASEIEDSSPPISREPLDREKMLIEYNNLKEELKKEGLLP